VAARRHPPNALALRDGARRAGRAGPFDSRCEILILRHCDEWPVETEVYGQTLPSSRFSIHTLRIYLHPDIFQIMGITDAKDISCENICKPSKARRIGREVGGAAWLTMK
jgi:hypothetical protein